MPPSSNVEGGVLRDLTTDQDIGSRVAVTLFVVSVAVISLYVFTTNNLFLIIEQAASKSLLRLGWGFSIGAVLVLILLMVISIASLSEVRLKAILHLSAVLYIPSILHFSNIDPLYILGFPNDLSQLSSTLPGIVLFVNGALIVLGYILLRSYSQHMVLRRNLIARGADKMEVTRAIRKGLTLNLAIIAFTSVVIVMTAAVVTWTSIFLVGQGMIGLPLLALVLSLALIILFIFILLRPTSGPIR